MVNQQSAELRKSGERYRAIVQDQTELTSHSLPNGHILTFVNDAYCRQYGKTRDEMLGSCLLDIVPEDERDNVRRRFA